MTTTPIEVLHLLSGWRAGKAIGQAGLVTV
jgi:hypothetical protein